jgi:hypothetical protein
MDGASRLINLRIKDCPNQAVNGRLRPTVKEARIGKASNLSLSQRFADTNCFKNCQDITRSGKREIRKISGLLDLPELMISQGFKLMKPLTSGKIERTKMRPELVGPQTILNILQIPGGGLHKANMKKHLMPIRKMFNGAPNYGVGEA